jgi:succinate dehydrogenase/fumarate reductase flavoprotein subunit
LLQYCLFVSGAPHLFGHQVQVHPTGFVDPADPAAGTKVPFCSTPCAIAEYVHHPRLLLWLLLLLLLLQQQWLAPEELRGCGAILLNSSGQRFVDKLTTRDKVTAALIASAAAAAAGRCCCSG